MRPPDPPAAAARVPPGVQLALPAATIFAALVRPSLPGLPYLLSFLLQAQALPLTAFPYTPALLLLSYSLLLLALHVALAALVSQGRVSLPAATLSALGVPRYDVSAWQGLRHLLGPLLLSAACVGLYLSRRSSTSPRYFARALALVRVQLALRAARAEARRALPRGEEPPPAPPLALFVLEGLDDEVAQAEARGADDVPAAILEAREARDGIGTFVRSAGDVERGGDRPSDLVLYLAGYGGVFWSTAALALLGMSYSSVLTAAFLLPTLLVMVMWASRAGDGGESLARAPQVARAVRAVRGGLALYVVAQYVFQVPWLHAARDTDAARFVGLVPLDTAVDGGWAHVMAFGAALLGFVFVSVHVRSVLAERRFEEYVRGRAARDAWSEGDPVEPDGVLDGSGAWIFEVVDEEAPASAEDERAARNAHLLRGGAALGAADVAPARLQTFVSLPSTGGEGGTSAGERSASSLRAPEEAAVVSETLPGLTMTEETGGWERALAECVPGAEADAPPPEPLYGDSFANQPRLSYNTELFLHGLVHLSTLGLLSWALVFPGLLSLPLLLVSLLSLFSHTWRSKTSVDKIVWYALALEMTHFLLAAVTHSFGLRVNGFMRILGLVTFNPQFAMNLVQTVTVGLLCVNIFAKRELRKNGGATAHPAGSPHPGDKRSIYYFTEMTMKMPAFAALRVFVDLVALASLYITGGDQATVLNSLFLIALVTICVFQASPLQHPKALPVIWTVIMAYSSVFLVVKSSICTAGKDLFRCGTPGDLLGLSSPSTGRSIAHAATVVLSAVQVHFTWPKDKDNRDSERVSEFRSRFWTFLREYFVFFAYSALLLYPLVYPANYLSYVYIVFLWICILVEILAPSVGINKLDMYGSRSLIRAYWLVVVVYASIALLARYIVRFDKVQVPSSVRMWLFGLDRGVIDYQITLGDAVILIMMSLQGRIFNISQYMPSDDSSISFGEGSASKHGAGGSVGDAEALDVDSSGESSGRPPSEEVVALDTEEERAGPDGVSARGFMSPQLTSPAILQTEASMQTERLTTLHPRLRDVRSLGLPSRSRRLQFRDDEMVMRSQRLAHAGLTADYEPMDLSPTTEGDSDNMIPTGFKTFNKFRKSLPMQQTEQFLSYSVEYMTIALRSVLKQYNYVLEAVAILVAAVWLDGITVFGAIYLVIGCGLMVSEQVVHEAAEPSNVSSGSGEAAGGSGGAESAKSSGHGVTEPDVYTRLTSSWSARYVPPVLVILSFCLMSLQYLFIIISSSGRLWGETALYLGLQATPKTEDGSVDIGLLPISQNAMLAHVLVFVMAFLQRAAVRWASIDVKILRNEEDTHKERIRQPLLSSDMLSKAQRWPTPNAESSAEAESLGHSSDGEEVVLHPKHSFRVHDKTNDVTDGTAETTTPLDPSEVRLNDMQLDVPDGASRRSVRELSIGEFDLSGAVGAQDPTGDEEFDASRSLLAIGQASRRVDRGHSSPVDVPGNRIPFLSSFPRDGAISGGPFALKGISGSQKSLHSLDRSDPSFPCQPGESVASFSRQTDADFQGIGVEDDKPAATRLQSIREGIMKGGRIVLKRTTEIFSLLTPFWQNWGFDLTFMYLVIGGVITESIFSVIYIAFVLVVGRLRKSAAKKHWRKITLTLAFLVISQYLLTLGLPPVFSSIADTQEDASEDRVKLYSWLYIEAFVFRKDVFVEAPSPRKASIMFGFMAVICAGITFNSLDREMKTASSVYGNRRRKRRLGAADDLDAAHGDRRLSLAHESASQDNMDRSTADPMVVIDQITHAEQDPRLRIVRYQPQAIAIQVPGPPMASHGMGSSGVTVLADGVDRDLWAASESVVRGPPSDPMMRDGLNESTAVRNSERGSARDADDADDDPDFTRQPLSFRNWVKLTWMRFAGSAVQLCMFAIATVDTNIMSAVLLFMSFYFFFQFTNLETKQVRFVIVRTYVLLVILALVIYQSPIDLQNADLDRARIAGLYKVEDEKLLYLFLALWLLCQMQSRIYESKNFKFVVKCTEEDEKLRHRRAVYEHNDRLYARMLGQNKNARAQADREARHNALQTLKSRNDQAPTDMFYRVCVVNWVAKLKKRAQMQETKDQRQREEEEKAEHNRVRENISGFDRTVRFILRGSEWIKHHSRPLWREFRLFVTRYSAWPVYVTMVLAIVFAPSLLTLGYPLILFLYLILEKPRPPRSAWTALIVYVYAVILIKYIGRKPEFDFVSCPDSAGDDYTVPFFSSSTSWQDNPSLQPGLRNVKWCVISSGLFFDVLVLLALLWHRAQLYYRGLWDLPRSEEDLRLTELIQGEEITEGVDDMKFTGFHKDDIPPSGYDFSIAEEPSEPQPPSQYESVLVEEQVRAADDVLREASLEIAQLANDGKPELWDLDMLASSDAVDEQSVDGAVQEASDPEGDVQSSKSESGPREAMAGRSLSPEPRLADRFGDDSGHPSDRPRPMRMSSRGNLWENRPARVGFHVDVREENTGQLRQRRGAESQNLQPTLRRSTTDSEGPRSPRRSDLSITGGSIRSADGLRFGAVRRRPSMLRSGFGRGTARPEEEDENYEESDPALQSLLQSNVLFRKSEMDPRHTMHVSGMPKTDPGEGPDTGGANLDALRTRGARAGPIDALRAHYQRLLQENLHKTVGDYYIAIFSMDFLCFVYMMFGYSYIFESQTSQSAIRTWWQSNFIASDHLLALIVLFFGIILDRVVYLRKAMRWKLVLQYISVVGYHYWLFWATNIGTRNVGKVFYILKCVYFLLSGLQIRTGYPRYTTGQYLLRKYSTGGLVLFTLYENIPFLWLTRTLLDWAVVPTSLELFQYFRFVDIYMWLYRNRAVNTSRGMFKRKLGERRWWFPRLYQGFGLSLLCGLLLFFPFLLFSFLNPFISTRNVSRATISVDFVSKDTTFQVFERSTETQLWEPETDEGKRELNEFGARYGILPVLRENENLFGARFAALSDSLWTPAPTDVIKLVEELRKNDSESPPRLSFSLAALTNTQVFRQDASDGLDALGVTFEERLKMADSIENANSFVVRMRTPLSKHLILASGSQRFQVADGRNELNKWTCMRGVFVSKNEDPQGASSFWSFEDCPTVRGVECECTLIDGISPQSGEEVSASELAKEFDINVRSMEVLLQIANVSSFQFGGGTILTVYAAILFTVAGLARRLLSDKRLIIPYIDMPYTLHLYQLVLDIVYARQDEDFAMEEILYNGLIDIYRDTHELARWTGQRALKPDAEWWDDAEFPPIYGYEGWPAFRCTETEPYIERKVD